MQLLARYSMIEMSLDDVFHMSDAMKYILVFLLLAADRSILKVRGRVDALGRVVVRLECRLERIAWSSAE